MSHLLNETARMVVDKLARNHPLPAGLTTVGHLYLEGYPHPLPEGLTTVGNLNLGNYKHPLPDGLTTVGSLHLGNYKHPLPDGVMVCWVTQQITGKLP